MTSMVRELVEEDAAEPCEYGDDCPDFGTRHGRCRPCKARRAIAWDDANSASKQICSD